MLCGPARCIRLKRSGTCADGGIFIKTAEAVRDCDIGRNWQALYCS